MAASSVPAGRGGRELPWLVNGRTNLKAIPPRKQLQYTSRWTKGRMDDLRLQGDPLADLVSAELHANHGGLTNIYDLLSKVRAKAQEETGKRGAVFRDFLAASARIPAWADREKIERGQRVWAVHMPLSGLSGLCGALVGGAQFATAAVVTALAGNMSGTPVRRLNETGLLLGAMAFPGSLFEPGSQAHDSLTRVRLLHGALRHWLPRSGKLKAHPDLVPERIYVPGEVPVNQEDLAIALGLVGYLNLRNLRHMSVVLSAHDIDCYIQMWRYAGYVLGISEDLLPATLEDQEEFMLCAMLHQAVPEWVPGEYLNKFIGEFAKSANTQSHGLVPHATVQTFLGQMSMYLNGEDYTTGLKIENLGSEHWTVRMVRAFGYIFGTVLPRVPFCESALFHWNTFRLRRDLMRRTPTGDAAGSGATKVQLSPVQTHKLEIADKSEWSLDKVKRFVEDNAWPGPENTKAYVLDTNEEKTLLPTKKGESQWTDVDFREWLAAVPGLPFPIVFAVEVQLLKVVQKHIKKTSRL